MKKLALIALAVSLSYSGYTQLQIDVNGKVGVGGIAPSSRLHLRDNVGSCIVNLQSNTSYLWKIGNYVTGPWGAPNSFNICDDTGYPKLTIGQSETDINDRLHIGAGYAGTSPILTLQAQKYMMFNTAGDYKSGLMFLEVGPATASTTQYGAKIEYDGSQDALILGTYQNWAARNSIFIDRIYGGVGIGDKLTGTTYKLKVFGRAITTHSVWETSDIRFKEDIKDISTEKSKLNQLRGVSYIKKQQETVNSLSVAKNSPIDKTTLSLLDTIIYPDLDSVELKKPVVPEREYGFVAQEVIEIFPDLVIEDEEGYLAINYTGFIPLIIEAYKDQQSKIEDMEQKIILLTKKIKSSDNYQTGSQTSYLYQNNPNPFSESTEIKYSLDGNATNAMINIYDMIGTQLKSIELYNKGEGNITINGHEFKAGMYMYSLIVDGQIIDTRQMILTD